MEKQLLAFISFLLFASSAFSQADSSKTLKEVKVRQVIPTGAENLNPSQQITARDFKRVAAYNVADAIRDFAGVNIRDYGGIGGLKTVSVRSLGANHTGVQIDGVQVSDAQNGQIDLGRINLENVSSITLYNGHSAELLQPAKAYASASMLVIRSLSPEFENGKTSRLSLGMKSGSFGLLHPSLLWQQKISNRWSLNFNTNWQKANGQYKYKVEGDGSDTLAVRNNAEVSTLQTDASVYWKGADSNRFQFRVNYVNSSRGLPGAVIYYNPYSNQHLWNRDLFLQSSYQQYFNNKWELLVNAKFSRNKTRYNDPDYLNIAGELDERYRQIELYESAALAYRLSDIWKVSVASDVTYNKLNTSQYGFVYPTRFTFQNAIATRWSLKHLNLQANLLNTTITEKVKIGEASPSKSIRSPAISIDYTPLEDNSLVFRAFYKNIFRNPTFNDLYYTRIGERSLKPEYAEQYNLGVTYQKYFKAALHYVSLTADAYYNKIKDKIIAIPNKDLFTWTMMNLGLVDIRGLDVGTKMQVALGQHYDLNFSGNYTYQKAIDITDPTSSVYLNQIPYTPEHTIAVNAGISNNRTGIYYNHIFSSSRYFLSENRPENYVPGFSVSDLTVTHQLQTKFPISLAVEINNLFNQSYAFIRSYPMPGRSYRLSFQITIK